MNVKRANMLTGGLGSPSKMPGKSYGLPAAAAEWVPSVCQQLGLPVPPTYGCPVGAKLAAVKGTVCHGCYADQRGFYQFSNAQAAQVRRLCSLFPADTTVARPHYEWEEAMAFLINRQKEPYFRWHDSGDLLGMWHLIKIVEVCKRTPKIRHWLPTREKRIVNNLGSLIIPRNLIIRLSATKVDGNPPQTTDILTSTVHRHKPAIGFACPAPTQGNQCGGCRQCWHREKKNVSYHYH